MREMIHDGRKVKIRAGFFLESSFFIYIYMYILIENRALSQRPGLYIYVFDCMIKCFYSYG